jgi:hypothetical protein
MYIKQLTTNNMEETMQIMKRTLENEFLQLGAEMNQKKDEVISVIFRILRDRPMMVKPRQQVILQEFTVLVVKEFEDACNVKGSPGEDWRTHRLHLKNIRADTIKYLLVYSYLYGGATTHMSSIIQETSIVHHIIRQLAVCEGSEPYDLFSHNYDTFYNFAFQLLSLEITQSKLNETMTEAGNSQHMLKAMHTYFEHSLRAPKSTELTSAGPSATVVRSIIKGDQVSARDKGLLLKWFVLFMLNFTKEDRFRPAIMKLSFLKCIHECLGIVSDGPHEVTNGEMLVLRKLVRDTRLFEVLAVILNKRETPEKDKQGHKFRADIIDHVQNISHYILKTDGATEMELGAQCSAELIWALSHYVGLANVKRVEIGEYWTSSLRTSIAKMLVDKDSTDDCKAYLFEIVEKGLSIVPRQIDFPPMDTRQKKVLDILISTLNKATPVDRKISVVDVIEETDEESRNPPALHIKISIIHRFFELGGKFNEEENYRYADIVRSLVEVISIENKREITSRYNIVLALQTLAFVYKSVSEDLKGEVVRTIIDASAFKHIYDTLSVVYEDKLFTAHIANSAYAILSIVMFKDSQRAIDNIRIETLDLGQIFDLTMDRFLQSGHLYIESGEFAFDIMRTLIVSSETAIGVITKTELMPFLEKVLGMYSFANMGTPDISRVVYASVASIVKKLMEQIGDSDECKEFWDYFPYLLVLLSADWSAIPSKISLAMYKKYVIYLNKNNLPQYLTLADTFHLSTDTRTARILKMSNKKKFVLKVDVPPRSLQVEDFPIDLTRFYPWNGKSSPYE